MKNSNALHGCVEFALRNLSLFVLIRIFSLTAGCAVTPEQRAEREPQAVKLEPKQGVVMLKVGSNKNIGTFFGKWQTLIVKSIETGKTFNLPVTWVPERTIQ